MVDHKKYLLEICEKVDQDLASPTCKKLGNTFRSVLIAPPTMIL